ncbi:MAG: glycosyltransferase family 2 protein [Terrimesophilobacter sp.]
MQTSVIIPTFNEAGNIHELVARVNDALRGQDAEIIFVDDSADDTPEVIRNTHSTLPVRVLHRDVALGGLSGAVVEGLAASASEWVVVMDGDLQHPPEMIPVLLASAVTDSADVVIASRHVRGGSSAGLDGWTRTLASSGAKMLTRAMFPRKLQHCTDPMTGFFAVRRAAVNLPALRPQGFKILLEILGRSSSLKVIEEPFVFGERQAGVSKASMNQGLQFLLQLAGLRFGRLSGFALIGAIGAVANLVIMAGLQAMGVWYLTSAIVAAVVTMVGNFMLQEKFIFPDLRNEGYGLWKRFMLSFGFNSVEAILRTTALYLIVETTPLHSLVTQAMLIAVGFLIRFVYHSRVVYRPRGAVSRVIEPVGLLSPVDDLSAL